MNASTLERPPPPRPRAYQSRVIAAARASVVAGRRRPLIVSPTGSGKTITAALIVAGAAARGTRVAWFAHRGELREQAVAALERVGLDVGHSGRGAGKLVQVVSVQGAAVRGEVPDAGLVVFDEAHHFASDDWGRLPSAYGPETIFVGLTATPERGDGRGLGHLFDDLHVAAQPSELVELWQRDHTQGLVPCEILRPRRVQPKGTLCSTPVAAYELHAAGKRNVVFAPTVDQAIEFQKQFEARGIPCALVHGKLPADQRRKALERFTSGDVLVLINVFVLTEGWDCPATSVITIARKMGSVSMFLQAVGRGLRPAPGKERALLLDLAGISHLHGSPLEDRIYSLDGLGIQRKGAAGVLRLCRVCGEPIEVGEACATCGTDWASAKPLEYTRDPLEKFAKFKTDTEAERVQRLAKWIREERSQGHQWQRARYRYKGTYGELPPRKILAVALELARAPRGPM